MGVGLNDNNAILNSVDVVVEVGVELGNFHFIKSFQEEKQVFMEH